MSSGSPSSSSRASRSNASASSQPSSDIARSDDLPEQLLAGRLEPAAPAEALGPVLARLPEHGDPSLAASTGLRDDGLDGEPPDAVALGRAVDVQPPDAAPEGRHRL